MAHPTTTIKRILLWACIIYSIYSVVWMARSPTARGDLATHVNMDRTKMEAVGRIGYDWIQACRQEGSSCLNFTLVQDVGRAITRGLKYGKTTACDTFCAVEAEVVTVADV